MPHAVQFTKFGGPEVLHLVDVPDKHPSAGEVRLRVKAVGLNPFDSKRRSGLAPMQVLFPAGSCSDLAGIVDEVGEGASYVDGTPVAVGDEVLGWSSDYHGLAEQAVVPASHVTLRPAALAWEQAGGLMTAGLTADAAITTLDIGAADTVLLSAAAGAVGQLYAQLAVQRGAAVIGTASVANHEFLRSLGAIPVAYGPGLADRVRTAAPTAITAVQDNVGRETIDAGLELGVPANRICSIVDHTAVAELGLASPGRYERSAATLGRLAASVADGTLQLAIQRVFPVTEYREAFGLLETRHLRGKVVVVF